MRGRYCCLWLTFHRQKTRGSKEAWSKDTWWICERAGGSLTGTVWTAGRGSLQTWKRVLFGKKMVFIQTLGGGFKDFLFLPLPGEKIQFDEYVSNGLKPPTRTCLGVTFHQVWKDGFYPKPIQLPFIKIFQWDPPKRKENPYRHQIRKKKRSERVLIKKKRSPALEASLWMSRILRPTPKISWKFSNHQVFTPPKFMKNFQ